MKTVNIIYASGSGHTEWVVTHIAEYLKSKVPEFSCTITRAELAKPETFMNGDVLLLASGTWNTGGIEGQLQPYMYTLLNGTAKAVELKEKPCTIVALGDDRYFYTARAGEHLRSYIVTHGGKVAVDALTIINEPYGQEERIEKWSEKFLEFLKKP